ncbi:hypothetical protein [Streptomyces sp. NPDC093089]|uniref:hypothetical protein n=1 Tax=Streptomyces sp. NPDC093089 TaxID=3366024 RepID=UPI00382ECBC7
MYRHLIRPKGLPAMLIYAFRDAHGTWYGDPDTTLHALPPRRGTLTLPSTSPGLFDGQRVEVLYAPCEAEPSQTGYRLDDGSTIPATWQVHELLSPAYRRPVPTPPPPIGNARDEQGTQSTSTVRLEIDTSHRRYNLHVDLLPEGRAAIDVVVCTPDGVILGELTGEVATSDLGEISRLLAAAPVTPDHPSGAGFAAPAPVAAAPSVKTNPEPKAEPKATRHGQAWTTDAVARLEELHRAGKSPDQLAEELGRSEKSIRWKLYGLHLAPYPGDAVPAPRAPVEPEEAKAYTVDEKRRLHPNAYKPWEPDDDHRLAEHCAEGVSLTELARRFGRNEGAVASRLLKIQAKGPAVEEAWEYGG